MKQTIEIAGEGWATWGEPGDGSSPYRYALGRRVGPGTGKVCFIGLNPSTATASEDDPTIRRCKRFARDSGAGELVMLNIFAFRSTDPYRMMTTEEPVGPENDRTILLHALDSNLVVAAWGTHGAFRGRGRAVRQMLAAAGVPLHFLRLTKDGHPAHPLYLPAALKPVVWGAP